MRFKVRRGLRIEQIDGDVVVLDSASAGLHRLSGDAARAVLLVDDDAAIPSELHAAAGELVELGILESDGWSRRKMLIRGGAGIAVAGAGVVSMSLPAAAAACSVGTPGKPYPLDTAPGGPKTVTFTTGHADTSVILRAYGAGGGGGVSGSNGRAGGGGGAFAETTVRGLKPCTTYTLAGVVGAGDFGTADGGAGGDSSLSGTLEGQPISVIAKGGSGANGSTAGLGGVDMASTGTTRQSGAPGSTPGGANGGKGGSAGGLDGGAGGAGGNGAGASGSNGSVPGGGGGGGGKNASSGNGASGGISATFS